MIVENGFYTNAYSNVNEDKKPSILEKISAIRSLSEVDGVNLTIAEELLNKELTSRAEISNSQNAIALMQIADSTLNFLSESASKMRELSVSSNNAALNSNDQSMIEAEAKSLKDAMSEAMKSATFNDKPIFGNSFEFYTGETTTINFDTIDVNSLSATNLNSVDDFFQIINEIRNDVGSNINALDSSVSEKLNSIVQDVFSMANIDDNDLVKNLIELTKERIQGEAMLFVQSQNKDYLQKQAMVLLT
jgi:flagellin